MLTFSFCAIFIFVLLYVDNDESRRSRTDKETGRYFRRSKAHSDVAYRERCLEGRGGCHASRFVKSDVIPALELRRNRGGAVNRRRQNVHLGLTTANNARACTRP